MGDITILTHQNRCVSSVGGGFLPSFEIQQMLPLFVVLDSLSGSSGRKG